jgi:hypothetical protein
MITPHLTYGVSDTLSLPSPRGKLGPYYFRFLTFDHHDFTFSHHDFTFGRVFVVEPVGTFLKKDLKLSDTSDCTRDRMTVRSELSDRRRHYGPDLTLHRKCKID